MIGLLMLYCIIIKEIVKQCIPYPYRTYEDESKWPFGHEKDMFLSKFDDVDCGYLTAEHEDTPFK